MQAWPALETIVDDGWVHRFSGGYTRRSNSVHPLYPSRLDLELKIGAAEHLYHERGLPAIFKLTPASLPEVLDESLAARGYTVEARTAVYVAEELPRIGVPVTIETSWDRTIAWREVFRRIGDVTAERRALHDEILASITLPMAFASVEEGGRTVACALGVVESAWLGIFDVIVDPAARRCGHGEKLMRGLMAWGCEMGAKRAYLQVMFDNAPALSLYKKLEFHEAYPYWYRVRRTDDRASREPASGDSAVGFGFSYQTTQGGDVLIRRGGRIVTHLRQDAAREFLADAEGACFADQQMLMARTTGNYKRGNERRAEEHPRRRGRT